MRVKAAINGGTVHPSVPLTPDQLAEDVLAVAVAGAFAVHFHPRDGEGRETLAAHHVDAALRAIRARRPPIPIGVTTGAWISGRRLEQIRWWSELPDFASVNFDEEQAEEVAEELLSRGVGIEAGLCTPAAAERYLRFGRCMRVLLEPQERDVATAAANVERMESVLAGDTAPRVLHGTGVTAWPMLHLARSRGYDGRIGFEDTLLLEDGAVASSNAGLVRAALAI